MRADALQFLQFPAGILANHSERILDSRRSQTTRVRLVLAVVSLDCFLHFRKLGELSHNSSIRSFRFCLGKIHVVERSTWK